MVYSGVGDVAWDPMVAQGLSPVPAPLMGFLPQTREGTLQWGPHPKSWGWVLAGQRAEHVFAPRLCLPPRPLLLL